MLFRVQLWWLQNAVCKHWLHWLPWAIDTHKWCPWC